jgi:GPI mannosyltransferase 1 subunit M
MQFGNIHGVECGHVLFVSIFHTFLHFAKTNQFGSYGYPFIHHTYLHHLTRIDHRHNFSPYSTVLYLNSSPAASTTLHFESLAFIPQLFLSVVAIPLVLAKKDLAATMLAQTFAFVAWNKVCTSQVRIYLTIRKHSVLTKCLKVLSLVYDLPPILPSQFVSSP